MNDTNINTVCNTPLPSNNEKYNLKRNNMNYIQIKFPFKYEDRFIAAISLPSCKLKDLVSLENIEIEDERDSIIFLLDYSHARSINTILNALEDISDLMGIPILYRYIYYKEEAYTGADIKTHRVIKYRYI